MFQPEVILVILDGWGYSAQKEGNAIALAKTPNFNKLWKNYPHALLESAGEPVGLPWGSIGSSEVGHSCLGSGRVIHQDLPRITKSIISGQFYRNNVLYGALEHAKKFNSSLHLVGLVSAGGVHSHINHLLALLNLLYKYHFNRPSYIQMFTDGRDSPPKSAQLYINKIEEHIGKLRLKSKIASVIGRYYAMDRDSHWERTLQAYECLVSGKGEVANSPQEAILNAYARGETDEFIKPTVIIGEKEKQGILSRFFGSKPKVTDHSKEPIGLITDNDSVIFFNFRPERTRQIVENFLFPRSEYPNKKLLNNLYFASIVEYDKSLPINVVLPPEKIDNPLAKILSMSGKKQLHIAETEKYAHATYFFDGGNPVPNKDEDWVVVPTPRVATHDLKPEMSAAKITDKLIELTRKKPYDFVVINYANADIVGHTGNLQATIKAIETLDNQLGKLTESYPESKIIITADHGNAEKMTSSHGDNIDTEHSVSPVPFILVGSEYKKSLPEGDDLRSIGILADIAPTVLGILKITQPPEMTGYDLAKSLIE